MSAIWQKIRADGLRTLAVMGMSKNTGKTVALNHVLAKAHDEHLCLGVTSIGRDGEDRDQVFNFPKPPVLVWPGQVVATARMTLQRSKVAYKLLGTTGLESPIGEIVLVKALEHGAMEVAGASRSSEQAVVISRLQQCGAELVLLDGALGRSHHASPAIADGIILATGAAIGGAVQDVVRKTRDRLAILGIQEADEALKALVSPVLAHGQSGVALWSRDGTCLFHEPIATLNAGPVLLRFLDQPVGTVAVSGAVGKTLWQALMKLGAAQPGLRFVVMDGTKLFVDAVELAQFERQGGVVRGLRGIRLTGLTLNPFSPMGGHFDAEELLAEARDAFPHLHVTDVVLEESQPLGVAP